MTPGTISKKNIAQSLAWYLLLSVIVIGLSIYRTNINDANTIYKNYDATYHALLTIHALNETEASVHRWLSIISLGGELNKNIGWGATIPDHLGNYYYTSLPPLAFIIPYAYLKLFNLEISAQNLTNFNFFIGLIAVLLLFYLIKKISSDYFLTESNLPAGLAAIGYATSAEFLFSHGYIYWGQSILQVFLICFLLNLLNSITKKNTKSYFLLFLFGFLMAATEWTGYVCLLVSMLYFLPGSLKLNKYSLKVFCLLGSAGILAAAFFIIPFISVIHDYALIYKTLLWRATDRGFNKAELNELFKGYWSSFGVILAILPLSFAAFIFKWNSAKKNGDVAKASPYVAVFVIAFLTVAIENLLMKEHAISYTYDRLKLIIPIAMLIPYLWVTRGKLGNLIKTLLIFLVLSSSLMGILYYSEDYRLTKNTGIESNNIFIKNVDLKNSIIGIDFHPSSYVAILFHKNFYENVTVDKLLDFAKIKNTPKATMINYAGYWPGFIRITSLDVYNADKETMTKYTLAPCDTNANQLEKSGDLFQCMYHFDDLGDDTAYNLTDNNWNKGMAKFRPGFLLMGVSINALHYKVGNQVIFVNQEKRTIVETANAPPFFHVFVDGPLLDGDKVGWPMKIKTIKKTEDR